MVLLALAAVVLAARPTASLDNGLALKPALGFNTWNTFGADSEPAPLFTGPACALHLGSPPPQPGLRCRPAVDEDLIKQTADLLVSSGLRDLGYTYLVLDDAWSEPRRTADGLLVGNQQRFPSGMPALGDYIHSRWVLGRRAALLVAAHPALRLISPSPTATTTITTHHQPQGPPVWDLL